MNQFISGQAGQHGINLFINHVKAMLTHFDTTHLHQTLIHKKLSCSRVVSNIATPSSRPQAAAHTKYHHTIRTKLEWQAKPLQEFINLIAKNQIY